MSFSDMEEPQLLREAGVDLFTLSDTDRAGGASIQYGAGAKALSDWPRNKLTNTYEKKDKQKTKNWNES